ncbi:hypothetical protein C8R45DRAFT_922729 [Mycena sanguinolenta]|nr:hypothetical protein C8R45DRAFT_922729 [Mycena sanguinolenta]
MNVEDKRRGIDRCGGAVICSFSLRLERLSGENSVQRLHFNEEQTARTGWHYSYAFQSNQTMTKKLREARGMGLGGIEPRHTCATWCASDDSCSMTRCLQQYALHLASSEYVAGGLTVETNSAVQRSRTLATHLNVTAPAAYLLMPSFGECGYRARVPKKDQAKRVSRESNPVTQWERELVPTAYLVRGDQRTRLHAGFKLNEGG